MKKLKDYSIYVRMVFAVCVWLFVLIPRLAFSGSTSFVPPSGKTLLFIGQDRDSIAHYVKTTGNVPGGVMLYTSIQAVDGLDKGAVDYGGIIRSCIFHQLYSDGANMKTMLHI